MAINSVALRFWRRLIGLIGMGHELLRLLLNREPGRENNEACTQPTELGEFEARGNMSRHVKHNSAVLLFVHARRMRRNSHDKIILSLLNIFMYSYRLLARRTDIQVRRFGALP